MTLCNMTGEAMELTSKEKKLIRTIRGLDERGRDRVYHCAFSEEQYLRLRKKDAQRVRDQDGIRMYHATR